MKLRLMSVTKSVVLLATVSGLQIWATQLQANTPADTRVKQALETSGFKVEPAATRAQREQLRALPEHQITMVKQNGTAYYLYPDKRDGRLYAGDYYAYRSFQNFFKNKDLRERGVFVWDVNPADRSTNKTIQIWHDWTPFDQWR